MFRSTYKRFATCVLSLLLCIVTLSGCFFRIHDSKYEKGDFCQQFEFAVSSPRAARSNKNKFTIDDVSFEFLFGLNKTGSTTDFNFHCGYDNYVIVLCICDLDELRKSSDFYAFEKPFEDYENLPKHYHIDTITEEEVLSDKYSYSIDFTGKFIYNHSEIVRIPREVFNDKEGTFMILLRCFNFDKELDGYMCSFAYGLDFEYQRSGEYVTLDFEKNKVYIP